MKYITLLVSLVCTLVCTTSCFTYDTAYAAEVDYEYARYRNYPVVWVEDWPYWLVDGAFIPYHHTRVLQVGVHYHYEYRHYTPYLYRGHFDYNRHYRHYHEHRPVVRHAPGSVHHNPGPSPRPHSGPDVRPQKPDNHRHGSQHSYRAPSRNDKMPQTNNPGVDRRPQVSRGNPGYQSRGGGHSRRGSR